MILSAVTQEMIKADHAIIAPVTIRFVDFLGVGFIA